MTTAPEKEEQLRRLIYELQLMQGSAEVLQQRMDLLQTALTDLRLAESSLKSLKELDEGIPILVPTGGNTFINAKMGDLRKVIVGVGADVSIEMDIDTALEDTSSRLADVEKASNSVQQQLEQLLNRIQVHRGGINRLSVELREVSIGV